MDIPYKELEVATNGFSEMLGFGGYAEVFKGTYEGKYIAVKKFYPMQDVDDKMFKNEFLNLQGVRHPNIVRSVGYCYEIQKKFVQHDGKPITSTHTYRMLCFEYLENGSLEEHISKESLGHNWCIHYQIIKGICEGLLHLHEGREVPIYHLDLKPSNILLDEKMVPKLADFGLSRLSIHGSQTHITKNVIGTRKYMPPEFTSKQEISCKNDVFSLGIIIIEVMAGRNGYEKFNGMSSTQEHKVFVQDVCNIWRERLSKSTMMGASPDVYLQQVKKCIEIAVQCVDLVKDNRPEVRVITELVRSLAAKDQTIASTSKEPLHVDRLVHYNDQIPPSPTPSPPHVYPIDGQICQEVEKDFAKLQLPEAKESETITLMSPGSFVTELIDIYPSLLLFQFELNKRSKCRLSISNKTDSDVQFFVDPKNYPEWYIHENRLSGFVHSHFTCAFHVVMKELKKKPPRDNDEFEIYLKPIRHRHHLNIQHQRHLDMYDDESDKTNNLDVDGGRDKNVTLKGVIMFRDPDPTARHSGDVKLDDEYFGYLTSMDVHPTKEWILMGYEGGHICIWRNLSRKEGMYEGGHDYKFIVTTERHQKGIPCRSVKFIVCRQWVVSGHSNGMILVHTYSDDDGVRAPTDEPKQVEKVQAHEGAVTSLAVHPSQPLVLSSSDDGSIRLWNWNEDEDWSCTREFRRQKGPVLQVAFNPRDASTFATVTTLPRTVKTWSIDSDDPVILWNMKVESIAYFTGNNGCYMAISMQKGRTKILDLESMTFVHTLQILDVESETSSLLVPPSRSTAITAVACHPKYPIIITGTSEGNVFLWNYSTYRLKESLWSGEDKVEGFGFMKIDGGFTRLLIRYADRIEMVDVQWMKMLEDPDQR